MNTKLKWILLLSLIGGSVALVFFANAFKNPIGTEKNPDSGDHSSVRNEQPEGNLKPEMISESGFHFEIHSSARSRQELIDLIGEHAARFDVGEYHRETRPHDDGFLETGSIDFFRVSLRQGSVEELVGPLRKTWERKASRKFRVRNGISYEHLSLIHERIPKKELLHIREGHSFCRLALYPDHFFYLSEQSGKGFFISSFDD